MREQSTQAAGLVVQWPRLKRLLNKEIPLPEVQQVEIGIILTERMSSFRKNDVVVADFVHQMPN